MPAIVSIRQKMQELGCCVIIPTYNNAGTLENVIRGVQDYTSDIIVVNDGSTDETEEILGKLAVGSGQFPVGSGQLAVGSKHHSTTAPRHHGTTTPLRFITIKKKHWQRLRASAGLQLRYSTRVQIRHHHRQ